MRWSSTTWAWTRRSSRPCAGGIRATTSGASRSRTIRPSSERRRGGGVCGFHYSFPAARELVCEWRRYALVRDCLTPEGASLVNHRYDQAILTVLLYRYERERGLRLTSDELDISSIRPVSFCHVR